MKQQMDPVFIAHAADVLGDTHKGLSGSEITKKCRAYALRYNVQIPHHATVSDAPNERTALRENLEAFSGEQQFQIIKELCEDPDTSLEHDESVRELRIRLLTKYAGFQPEGEDSDLNQTLVEETRHWLDGHPKALELYSEALAKYQGGAFQRNLLDDLRLALEKLVQSILSNGKSLENQKAPLGSFLKDRGGSPQFRNMFVTLLDYYTKYQNDYVKHDDAVIEVEIEFIFEITSSFMKQLVRISST